MVASEAARGQTADNGAANGDLGGDNLDFTKMYSQPIPGPAPNGPEWPFVIDYEKPMGPFNKIGRFMADLVRKPAHWIRENVVEPNRGPKYYWYHRKFPRALPIDECYIDDYACMREANLDYHRTHQVDRNVLNLLRNRRDLCHLWFLSKHGEYIHAPECDDIVATYKREEVNYHIKYGDLPYNHNVHHAYMKQKHRMIVDRRRQLKKEQEEAESKGSSE